MAALMSLSVAAILAGWIAVAVFAAGRDVCRRLLYAGLWLLASGIAASALAGLAAHVTAAPDGRPRVTAMQGMYAVAGGIVGLGVCVLILRHILAGRYGPIGRLAAAQAVLTEVQVAMLAAAVFFVAGLVFAGMANFTIPPTRVLGT